MKVLLEYIARGLWCQSIQHSYYEMGMRVCVCNYLIYLLETGFI